MIDINAIREQFPVLHQEVNGHPLVYFDNAATSQKPQRVIDALLHYYRFDNSNIHRGVHTLADRATEGFEDTRKLLARFINAAESEEVIFTKGTTEGINLVAQSFGRSMLRQGDEVIISAMEHHSNIVPWQMICQEKGAVLKVIPVSPEGELLMDEYARQLSPKTRMVSIVHVSNTLGTVNPVKKITEMAHEAGAKVLIDAAQSVGHLPLDVQEIDCDFLVFSAHKIYGPTGVGVLYGKRAELEAIPPYQGGGSMIRDVHFEKTTYNDIPYKFEAGTPTIGEVVAFKPAIEFINELGKPAIHAHEDQLFRRAMEGLKAIPGVQLVGTPAEASGIVSFLLENTHLFDTGMLLDARGIAVRTGHHCTQPLMELYGIEGTCRASFAVYNTVEEVDYFLESVEKITSR
ncbi:cysteine desulfurase/selenocysteine lyase [Anseongella ginsenosidimutans]|uniref:Cysteine desulfurase n=1 Tax=Anseongella ginsenosidimutans TaxID=496056 RepID=A0A4R3KU68_9SPHI|nr:cysteine desulfurase [Anseongella ginsenosidimutans]QEC53318.1 cysteine desulfurase [Anseongella ginsenosidimutans]TCS88195.1 cysteine desulfurase/selenocysteine lyase [Anseongella ginsenosidimutans]